MGLFANLLSKVFGHQTAATSPQSAGTAEPAAAGGPAPATVDVTAILVDLMKLVGMDSSLAARKELAKDLSYTGDTSDSATMNIWLHKVVIKKIAENGGKVPNELLA